MLQKIIKITWIIIILGFVGWIAVLILRFNHVKTVGDEFLIAPICAFVGLFIVSILSLIKNWKQVNKHAKDISKKKNRDIWNIPSFLFILISFGLMLTFFVYIFVAFIYKSSEAYEFITNHLENDNEFKEKTGEIYNYESSVSGSLSKDSVDFEFTVYGAIENVTVNFVGHKESSGWVIDELNY